MSDPELLIDGPPRAPLTLLLAHGAGAGMETPFMAAMAAGVAAAGFRVARFEFPYMRRRRQTGKRGAPDRRPVLEQAFRDAVAAAGDPARVVVGGKSMGGRIASYVADAAGVRGLVCLGYPFHPPGRPEVLRTSHLRDLRTPTLVLQGTRDPFGRPEEVARYELAPSIRVVWIEDGDHSFKPRKSSGRTAAGNLEEAVTAVTQFLASLG